MKQIHKYSNPLGFNETTVTKIEKAITQVVRLTPHNGEEEQDVAADRMHGEIVKLIARYRASNQDGGKVASLETFIVASLPNCVKKVVRFYNADKRKVFLKQNYEDSDTNAYLIETALVHTPDIQLQVDVREAFSKLEGDLKKLAEAFLHGTTDELGWSVKKLSYIKMKLRKEFQQYGFFS